MSGTLLTIRNLSKRFGGFTALNDVDLSVGKGERLALIGPNGSGKSTLVNCISGTLPISSGEIQFDGQAMQKMSAHARARLGIARSFQIPRPFASMTVVENIEIPLLYGRRSHIGVVAARHEALAALALVGLKSRANDKSVQLTQVDMRKLELARALVTQPRLLIADEAMAGLSDAEVDEILEVLFELNGNGIAVILIEHIMRAVLRFATRIAVLVAGRKIVDGDPEMVMRDPQVVKAYLGE